MTREARSEEKVESPRRKRTPLGTPRQKLQAPQRVGYRRRWVNDTPGRVDAAQKGDYGHVMGPGGHGGTKRSEIVDVRPDGSPLKAFLMEIPSEYHEADQREKQAAIDEVDETIQRGNIRGADSKDTEEKWYVPKDGISVRRD